jgi:hypothetical protein
MFSAEPEIDMTGPHVVAVPVDTATPHQGDTTSTTYKPDGTKVTTTTYTVPPPGAGATAAGTGVPVPPPSLGNLGTSSAPITCPHCHQTTRTFVQSEIDCFTIAMYVHVPYHCFPSLALHLPMLVSPPK